MFSIYFFLCIGLGTKIMMLLIKSIDVCYVNLVTQDMLAFEQIIFRLGSMVMMYIVEEINESIKLFNYVIPLR